MTSTLAQLLKQGITRLEEVGLEDAEISARLILRHILNLSAAELQLSANNVISDEKIRQFDSLIEKRRGRTPLQYLVGEVEFYNIKLKVDHRVLIPRPETEVMIENLIEYIKPLKSFRVLDIGTGSGNIAIAIAANIDNVSVTAVDISAEALDLAVANAVLNNVAGKIKFVQGDCRQDLFWENLDKFDMIVSNPPYVGDEDFKNLQPEIKDHEPKIALITGDDPLTFFKLISEKSAAALNRNGIICFEVGAGQAVDVARLIELNIPGAEIKIIKDLTGVQRVVIGQIR